MFDFFKNLFTGKPEAENGNGFHQPAPAPAKPASHRPAAAPTASQTTFRSRYPQTATSTPPAAPRTSATPAVSHTPSTVPHAHDDNGSSIDIPLSAILVTLPMELKARVRPSDAGTATMAVSLQSVFSQLASGSVKIAFGELRQTFPQSFTNAADCDETLVALPLSEILSRLNPALLVRRENQKQVEIPDEISSPFGEHGNGLIFAAGPKAPEATPPPRATAPAPVTPQIQRDVFQQKPTSHQTQPRAFQAPVPPAPFKAHPVPPASAPAKPSAPQPPTPATQRFHTNTIRPAAPAQQSAPTPPAHALRTSMAPTTPPPPPAPNPIDDAPSIPASAALRNLGKSFGTPAPLANTPAAHGARRAAAPTAPTAPSAPVADVPSLTVPLQPLAESWPEALRGEISQLNPGNAMIALPVALIEDAMRRGKITFPWVTIRSWIRPAPPSASSVHDSLIVELPLRILAPLFMARIKEGKSQHKVAVDEKIPNLFFGFPQPDAAAEKETPTPKPATTHTPNFGGSKSAETNYYVWNETSDAARTDETDFKRPPSIETNFLSRRATPNEVVAQASALDGVVGALVALPDGLMVASKVPAELNADTLAAFLPHIFGKVSQCTKELRMGDLNNLNFTVGNIPWKIFRVNAIYFAAFGRAGEGLPSAQLATLAAQLDRKKQ